MPYAPSTPAANRVVASVIDAIDEVATADRLLALRSLGGLVAARRASTVLCARQEGMSWQDIARLLGMSRQSVWDRYRAEDMDPPTPARGRRAAARAATHASSTCAAYKAVTVRPA